MDPILTDMKMPTAARAIPHPLPNGMVDLQKLLAMCRSDRERCLIAFLGLEGMRMHEALDLMPRDIDIADSRIRILGKGGVERYIPLTKRAYDHIVPHLIKIQIQFPGHKLIDYSDKGARNFVTALGKKAGLVRDISSHDLRATFATLAYAASKDLATVQFLLGHSDPKTTKIYIETPFDTARLVAELGED